MELTGEIEPEGEIKNEKDDDCYRAGSGPDAPDVCRRDTGKACGQPVHSPCDQRLEDAREEPQEEPQEAGDQTGQHSGCSRCDAAEVTFTRSQGPYKVP